MSLKILILSDGRTARLGAGNWVQARETVRVMQSLGCDATHMLYAPDGNHVPSGLGVIAGDFDYSEFDIVHFIPVSPDSNKVIKNDLNVANKPLLVASTIFWDSKTHRKVCARNSGDKFWLFSYWLRKYVPNLSRSWNRFEYFDLLLPNSDMEISVFRRNFRVKKRVSVFAIPNAVGEIPNWVHELEPLETLRGKDYILYPGVFAPRKNQLGFIRAMKNMNYEIVFMGGSLGTEESNKYFETCKREANSDWVFLGNVEHRSKKFFQVMKFAKVACLASSCETPGIALLEAAALGVRIAVTREGCTREYFGFEAEYFNPLSDKGIKKAVKVAWDRGELSEVSKNNIKMNFSWERAAERTIGAYVQALDSNKQKSTEKSHP